MISSLGEIHNFITLDPPQFALWSSANKLVALAGEGEVLRSGANLRLLSHVFGFDSVEVAFRLCFWIVQ